MSNLHQALVQHQAYFLRALEPAFALSLSVADNSSYSSPSTSIKEAQDLAPFLAMFGVFEASMSEPPVYPLTRQDRNEEGPCTLFGAGGGP